MHHYENNEEDEEDLKDHLVIQIQLGQLTL